MSTKIIASAALVALKEALANVYWYKGDLRSFLTSTLSDPRILARLDWAGYKRNIVGQLVDTLGNRQEESQAELLRLMTEVAKVDDFSHLERLEGGKKKVELARKSVGALRKFTAAHEALYDEQKKLEARRQKAHEEMMRTTAVRQRLEELKAEYYKLLGSDKAQRRGFQLEKIMRQIFDLFDLDPKASFRIVGEQIDGAFTFEATDYLFEAKWQKEMVGADDLDSFAGKLGRKLENTLGLFLSINGFSEDGVKADAPDGR